MNKSSSSEKGKRGEPPVGVKIISIFNWICSVIFIIAGLLFFVLGVFSIGGGFSGLEGFEELGGVFAIFGVFALVIGLVFLFFAVLSIFIAIGLWKGKNWARIIEIVFSCLGFLFSLLIVLSTIFVIAQEGFDGFNFSLNLFSLLYNSLIGLYLIFNSKAKEFFSSN